MTKERNNRTHPAERQEKVSLTLEGLGGDLQLGLKKPRPRFQMAIYNAQFLTWQRDFERKMGEQPDLQERFSGFIKAGCDKDDLEKALWWVVVNLHISKSATPTEMRDFFTLAETLLPQLEKLRPNLETLLNWRSQGKPTPGFDLFLGFLDELFPHLVIAQQRSRILPIPELLDHLYVLLRAIHDTYKMDPRTVAAHAATVPEILLFEYFKRATHNTAEMEEIMEQISEFQELAFEAYGVKRLYGRVPRLRKGVEVRVPRGRAYEEESWGRRYRHFKKKDPKMREIILRIVEEFMTQKARGKDISLIPFFVDSYSAVVRSQIPDSESSNRARKR